MRKSQEKTWRSDFAAAMEKEHRRRRHCM